MDDIDDQILNYDDLPAEERRAVDAYLAEHPEAEALLAEGRAVRSLLEAAARLGAEVPDAESIAQVVAAQHMAQRPLPADLAALGRRVEEAADRHPEVERRHHIMQDRLKTLTAGAESPRAQFERLAGRRLGARWRPESSSASATQPAAAPAATAPRRDRSKGWRASVTDHPSLSLFRQMSLPRLAFAATFLVVLVYGGLFLASRSVQPRTARLADLDAVENDFAGLRLRGPDGQVDPATGHYAAALETLAESRSSTLGLFPRYDAGGLTEAIHLLREVVELEEEDSALALEAWFLIGKILLYEGELDVARGAFQIVVEQQGLSAPDAQRLLSEIAEIAPAPALEE